MFEWRSNYMEGRVKKLNMGEEKSNVVNFNPIRPVKFESLWLNDIC